MSFPKFVVKNGARNKRRAMLTILIVALALFVVTTLATFLNQFERNLAEANDLRLFVQHAVSLGSELPERYGTQIARVPGVVAVTPLSWFGGLYIDQAHTDFSQFATDLPQFFDVYDNLHLPADQREAFIRDRTGVIVGKSKATKHGWKLGDRITLKGVIYPADMELTVRGIFTGTINQESAVYFNRMYLEESLGRPGNAGTFWVRVDSADHVARVADEIDTMFANSDAPTKTQTEKAFQMSFISMLGNLKTLVGVIAGAIIFTILLVTANTMAMSVRERIREVAVLKSLGLRRSHVLALLMGEGTLITFTGGLLGCFGARLFIGSLDVAVFSQGFLQELTVTWGIVGLGLVVAALVGALSAGIPAYRAANLTVADGLRHVG